MSWGGFGGVDLLFHFGAGVAGLAVGGGGAGVYYLVDVGVVE